MRLYQQHLDAGVKSGIDPKVNAKGFRDAGQSALRQIYIGGGQNRAIDSTGGTGGSAGSASPGSAAPPAP
jgi:hypothetical protein